jgi:hypothetical protein
MSWRHEKGACAERRLFVDDRCRHEDSAYPTFYPQVVWRFKNLRRHRHKLRACWRLFGRPRIFNFRAGPRMRTGLLSLMPPSRDLRKVRIAPVVGWLVKVMAISCVPSCRMTCGLTRSCHSGWGCTEAASARRYATLMTAQISLVFLC